MHICVCLWFYWPYALRAMWLCGIPGGLLKDCPAASTQELSALLCVVGQSVESGRQAGVNPSGRPRKTARSLVWPRDMYSGHACMLVPLLGVSWATTVCVRARMGGGAREAFGSSHTQLEPCTVGVFSCVSWCCAGTSLSLSSVGAIGDWAGRAAGQAGMLCVRSVLGPARCGLEGDFWEITVCQHGPLMGRSVQ